MSTISPVSTSQVSFAGKIKKQPKTYAGTGAKIGFALGTVATGGFLASKIRAKGGFKEAVKTTMKIFTEQTGKILSKNKAIALTGAILGSIALVGGLVESIVPAIIGGCIKRKPVEEQYLK